MTKLNINLQLDMDNRFPLYSQYDGQLQPQPCGFELNLENGELTTFVSGEIGNAVPAAVFHDRRLRFPVEPLLMPGAIKKLAEENAEKFQNILDDSEVIWNGNNHVGKLGEVAQYLHSGWSDRCHGCDTASLITVHDQMQYEDEPQTLEELKTLVNAMIGYDGDAGYYMKEPSAESIEQEVLDYLIEQRLYSGEEIGQEIAQLIIERGIDVGAWQEELDAFARGNEK